MTIGFILYAVLALLLSWAILAGMQAWRRPPYRFDDFWAASERIFVCVAGLAWLLEGTKLSLPDDFVLPEWAWGSEASAGKTLRRECRAMLRDILANTAFIMDQADRCSFRFPPNTAITVHCLHAINKGGWTLLLAVRWAQLLLALPLPCGVRSSLRVGQRYAPLWLALLEVLRNLHPEIREELAV